MTRKKEVKLIAKAIRRTMKKALAFGETFSLAKACHSGYAHKVIEWAEKRGFKAESVTFCECCGPEEIRITTKTHRLSLSHFYPTKETEMFAVPLGEIPEMGVSSNYVENSTYLQHIGADHIEFKYAKCYMYNEIFLIMENVVSYHKSRFHKGKLPGWADYIDCRQVGYNKDGVLVAYDFGR